ncbi:MAG: hypothetical protein HZB32_01370 [Nitrospirae bacterium]|nr:hypothetical protein [Nitrospirota bacterium]
MASTTGTGQEFAPKILLATMYVQMKKRGIFILIAFLLISCMTEARERDIHLKSRAGRSSLISAGSARLNLMTRYPLVSGSVDPGHGIACPMERYCCGSYTSGM